MLYQTKVSDERAATNVVGPPWTEHAFADFGGTQPLERLLATEAAARRAGREETGDTFLRAPRSASPRTTCWPSLAKTPAAQRVHGVAHTLPMGDHAAVDFCQGGHGGLLQEAGLLRELDWVRARYPAPPGSVWGILVSDDCIVLAVVDTSNLNAARRDVLARFDTARLQYERTALRGSPNNEVRDTRRASVLGAEIDASPEMIVLGHVPVRLSLGASPWAHSHLVPCSSPAPLCHLSAPL